MSEPSDPSIDRALTADEEYLLRWMLEHGDDEAKSFLPQIDNVRVTAVRCPCGCATLDFRVPGHDGRSGGMRSIADCGIKTGDKQDAMFVYIQSGMLGGIEVYACESDEAPKVLPHPNQLRPLRFDADGKQVEP